MARYGANELFNPGGRRKKKKEGVTTGSGSSVGSFGSMAHSRAPDASTLFQRFIKNSFVILCRIRTAELFARPR